MNSVLTILSATSTNIWEYIFVDSISLLLEGLLNTLLIVVCAFPIGIILGSLVGILHFAPKNNVFLNILKWISKVYVSIFRGTPIVVQLLFIYFALLSPLGIDSVVVAIIVFGLNSGAYVSEMVRAGIASVDQGQMEAGRSLGMSYGKTMFKIVMPQAIKNIIPTLGNELVSLTKETSVAGYITVMDITFALQTIASNTYDYFAAYFVLGIIYFVIVFIITQLVKLVERRLSRSDKR